LFLKLIMVRSIHSVDHVLLLNSVVLIINSDSMLATVSRALHGINIQPNKGDKKGNVERNCEVV